MLRDEPRIWGKRLEASDGQLVAAARAGDRAAYGTLVTRYQRVAVATALRVLNDTHAAQDAAQDAFVTAYEKLHTLRSPDAFGPWLLKITRRQAIAIGRRLSKHAHTPLDEAAHGVDATSNGQIDADQWALLEKVARLPKNERIVVMLRHFDGHAVAEIATLTSRPIGTVTKQLSRAHQRLRRWLEEEGKR